MATEFELGDYILVLDGRVLEIFQRTLSESARFHVAFLAVDVKRRGEEFKVRLGSRYGNDMISGGVRLTMNPEQFAPFNEFMSLAIAARDRTDT